ncbi:MAG TPA: alpha-amylase/4-alpha-glucanotransferase domain-containing protein [Pirellulales bacterium]|jgi:alpha-amylase|nr:alpha-amylase/4-alpha-glucanotransferase domain-containing protein [Pirellulales bacterium]
MAETLRLILVVHQHQPVGNFDAVIQRIYRDSYQPLLATFERWPALGLSLHTSGPLLEWLAAHHPDYIERLASLAAAGRVEILGGAYSDPILSWLPRADRVAQIVDYGDVLERRFGTRPRGMWLAERVWEPTMAADLASAGIEHTVLDDVRFLAAGLNESQLGGYWLTDDDSPPIALFTGSERLRYLIPYAPPEQVIAHLRRVARAQPGATIVYADDAEKFGAWPGMREHCFEHGWLPRFFEMLSAERDWLRVTTLREVIDHVPPQGRVYVPEGSYREMSTWSTLDSRPQQLGKAEHAEEVVDAPTQPAGTWRNFRVKYPVVDELTARMLHVSRRWARVHRASGTSDTLVAARRALHLGQCGDAYWHGIFGGAYLPHLRQAAYQQLIAADGLLDEITAGHSPEVSATLDDFNADVHHEVLLRNSRLMAFFAPQQGGMLYELDVRSPAANVLATFARRPEPYHISPAAPANYESNGHAEHRAEPAPPLVYDQYPRKSLLDHFFAADVRLTDVAEARAHERGDFITGRYERRIRRHADRVELELSRRGKMLGHAVRITKTIALAADSSVLDIEYTLEGLPRNVPCCFAVEFNLAGAWEAAETDGRAAGVGGEAWQFVVGDSLAMIDPALGVEFAIQSARDAGFWTFPVNTLSRGQVGLESIQQSTVVMPHWHLVSDSRDAWHVQLSIATRGLRHSEPVAGSL